MENYLYLGVPKFMQITTYSKIPILRPPFRLPKSGLISEVVLILNIIS